MKAKKYIFVFLCFLFVVITATVLYGSSTGYTGVTRKTGGIGCFCHGSISPLVTVNMFSAPDTVNPGQVSTVSLFIVGGPLVRGGIDVAVQNGVLDTIAGQGMKKVGTELTHRAPKDRTGAYVFFSFQYTAPMTPGKDTIYATGISVDFTGNTSGDQWNHAGNRIVVIRNPVGIVNNSTAESFQLYQNYPNPFNPSTRIRFSIPAVLGDNVKSTLIIYDFLGKEIRTLVNDNISPGVHEIDFDGSNLPSGVYYYKLEAGEFSETKKMLLVK